MPGTKIFNILPPHEKNTPRVIIHFGAGRLNIVSGNERQLIGGEALYDDASFRPLVQTEGDAVIISTDQTWNWKKISAAFNQLGGRHRWNLRLGIMPMELLLKVGATKSQLDLGGLRLQQVKMELGASDLDLTFSRPNKLLMRKFDCLVGAARASLTKLANTHTGELRFGGGAGEYLLDFSGQLRREMKVTVDTGVGKITIVVPDGIPCQLKKEAPLTTVEPKGGWRQQSNKLFTKIGKGPSLHIKISMAVGKLELR